MGKNNIRGSKNELRRVIKNAATQVQDMATTIAILLDRTGGETTITADEFINLDTKRRIDVKVNPDKSLSLRMVQDGESTEQESAPVTPKSFTPRELGFAA